MNCDICLTELKKRNEYVLCRRYGQRGISVPEPVFTFCHKCWDAAVETAGGANMGYIEHEQVAFEMWIQAAMLRQHG